MPIDKPFENLNAKVLITIPWTIKVLQNRGYARHNFATVLAVAVVWPRAMHHTGV